ncbi:MAG TPA: L-threonylcarbamoyladenylate synthase [Candidatus Binatia bacterium]|nr:L-threonylcarbamoyladenylate synthase [Candidatus Binatia bacterium]
MSKTETASSKAQNEAPENLAAAVEALKRGHVIVFPTETLYGLGADALNEAAVEIVFQLKGRDPSNPIPVLVANQEMLHTLVAKVPAVARKLMDRHWPGPLTLVLPGQKNIPKWLCNPEGKVGVRISSQPIATLLVNGLGRPLTATSANPSGKEPARTLQETKTYFAGRVELFVDGGTLTSKSGSTVVEVMEDSIKIIREGDISAGELQRFLGKEHV